MSKIIKLTQDYIDEACKEFKDSITNAKITDGKINFTKTFSMVGRKATLYFTEIAWMKMQALIREFTTEVGWHGVAKRYGDIEKDEYIIEDILVYPQTVTGATVNTDQEKYSDWLFSDELDDVFNDIRFHGHSHVNMGTTPSSTDLTHWSSLLDVLKDDMFYVFVIWNKKNDRTVKIYDLKKNVLFDTSDVTVKVLPEKDGVEEFVAKAKGLVEEHKYTYTAISNTSSATKSTGASPYSSTGKGSNYGVKSSDSKSGKTTAKDEKKDNKKADDKKSKGKKRKAKRVKYDIYSLYDDGIGGW